MSADRDDVRATMWMTCKGIETALRNSDNHKAANMVRGLAADIEMGEAGAMMMLDQVTGNLAQQVREAKRIETGGLIIPGGLVGND